jgi:1-acyl-sn-glycerol-3-phosphate acyltransferase
LLFKIKYIYFAAKLKSTMGSFLSKFILETLWGWKVTGFKPPITLQHIIVAAPHTSNWDFPVGVLARSVFGITHVKYLGKSSLFVPPIGWLFRALGGYPVERNKNTNFVKAVVEIFKKDPTFSVCISPEGTRKKVNKFRTGFYYIAKEANVPITFFKFDFKTKIADFSEPYYLTGDFDTDMKYIVDYFRGTQGYNYEYNIEYPWKED